LAASAAVLVWEGWRGDWTDFRSRFEFPFSLEFFTMAKKIHVPDIELTDVDAR
jgi:hypothetical protein